MNRGSQVVCRIHRSKHESEVEHQSRQAKVRRRPNNDSGKAVRERNMRQLHITVKKLVGKYCKAERLTKNEEDKPITEVEE